MTGDARKAGANDADLVRYLDGELDAADRARVESAVSADPTLADRLASLRRRGVQLRRILESTDPPLPQRSSTRVAGLRAIDSAPSRRETPFAPWLIRAAAAIVLLAGAIALVPPLRAWVAGQLERIAGTTAVVPGGARLLGAPDTVDVAFPVSFPTFDMELFAQQAGGTLRIRVVDADEARAEIHTRSGRESFFLFPGGLRVMNEEASRADYDIFVPRSVRLIRVTIGGRRVAEYATPGDDGADRTFELGPR